MFFDPLWLLFAAPGLILGLWAQAKVHSTYQEASRIPNRRRLSGAETAEMLLDGAGTYDVDVEPTHGILTDHYHPLERKLRLSEENYGGISLAAMGVAAHEAGHAIQHKQGYLPLLLRSALVPACVAGQWIGQLAILGSFLVMAVSPSLGKTLLFWALVGYAAVFLFTLITLPVEFDASRRALRLLGQGIAAPDELPEIRRVLNAAALTYVASAVSVLGALLHVATLYHRADGEHGG